ncbi:LANO_0H15500g1_1 [Lachancea nothofagi CBS 11611]|uniref:LANO_0H15500g1_1 n=1 Tax=Lachancea nothofagi CBS 11611 TaxID=1266666 RepID=A0A1G4KMU0_9SACH|nr:LANO_0H15500g1_1 [Lachancea nothofagi CBS 11611]
MIKTLVNGPDLYKPLETLVPLQFNLLGSESIATAFPVYTSDDVPNTLIDYLHQEFNSELEDGLTYPHLKTLNRDEFVKYWFHSFCVIVLKTDKIAIDSSWTNWRDLLLGTFYIKPNYPGRCSHNCNAGFLVNSAQRGQKVGIRLGQIYLKWAPLLGYRYSVFNLVFVTNPASWRIWDKLQFDRIGYIPKVAILKGYEEPVDAIMFGKDLTTTDPKLIEGLHI